MQPTHCICCPIIAPRQDVERFWCVIKVRVFLVALCDESLSLWPSLGRVVSCVFGFGFGFGQPARLDFRRQVQVSNRISQLFSQRARANPEGRTFSIAWRAVSGGAHGVRGVWAACAVERGRETREPRRTPRARAGVHARRAATAAAGVRAGPPPLSLHEREMHLGPP